MNQIDNITYKVADILGRRNDMPFIMSVRDTLWNTRAKYLRQDFNKNLLYRESALQDLGDIPLVDIPKEEKKRFSHCNLKRTERKIPRLVETNFYNKFKFVGTSDGSPDYQPTTEFAVENSKYELYPALFPSFFLKDGFLYVVNPANSVKVIAMFQDPTEADEFAKYKDANCSTLEDAFTPKDMVDVIEAEIMQKYAISAKVDADKPKDEIQL